MSRCDLVDFLPGPESGSREAAVSDVAERYTRDVVEAGEVGYQAGYAAGLMAARNALAELAHRAATGDDR